MKYWLNIFASLCFVSSAVATFQSGDILKYKDNELRIHVYPLDSYKPIAENKVELRIEPNTYSTGNYRGYVATWQILSNKLFLVGITGWIAESFTSDKKATLEALFPDGVKDGRVYADWFTGTIIYPSYRWGTSLSEEDQSKQAEKADLVITIIDGNVTDIIDRINPNHGLESTSAPPAAGTLETHP